VKYYDCCELGEVDKSDYSQSKLHEGFIKGGIDKAVERLIQIEKAKTNILAFSIGGVIAWQFGLKSENIESLCCISSTRLRHEQNKPSGEIKLFFGEEDVYKPKNEWFDNMEVNFSILQNEEHEMYKNSKVAEYISNQIIISV
jgi:hypothetical protein